MKKTLLLLVTLLASTAVWAADFITNVMVIGGSKTEVNNLKTTYTNQGWIFIDQDLNAGCGSSSDYVYLLYKKASNTNQDASAFITDLYISTASGIVPNSFAHNGLAYNLVPFDGSDYFKGTKGDLNSHCGSSSAYLHLYYATDSESYYRSTAVSSIVFNSTSTNAVCEDTTTTACDLNKGAGGDYIYMHANSALKGWTPYMNYTGTECYINGYAGVKNNKTEVTIPLTIDGATVLYFSGPVFNGFTNLETMKFRSITVIDGMPSVQGCTKFKHVNISDYAIQEIDQTPPSMTHIPSYAFAGTAIENITLDSVTNVGSYVFSGNNVLSSVTFNTSPVLIENGAFSEISTACKVSYPGSMEDWNPMMYMYSPNLTVEAKDKSWYCGWCGGANAASNNHLYWTLDIMSKNLIIDCATDSYDSYPNAQVITTHNWDKKLVKNITMNHVYSIGQRGFEGQDSLVNVYANPTLHAIGKEAFYGCNKLERFWFEGTEEQWDGVTKDNQWLNGASYQFDDTRVHWRCTVTFDANGHGTAPPAQTNLWRRFDFVTEPPAPTADGYEFLGWYTEPECTGMWPFKFRVPGDMTLYAKWEAVNVSVPGDVNGDGSVTSADVTALYNYLLNGDESYLSTSDVDGDGNITSGDITFIYNILLGN